MLSNYSFIFRKKLAVSVLFASVMVLLAVCMGICSEQYKTPSDDIVRIIDAPWNPRLRLSPDGRTMAFVTTNIHPPIEAMAQPLLKLAELKINPDCNARQVTVRYEGITLKDHSGKKRKVLLPEKSVIDMPLWNSDSSRLAFIRYGKNETSLYFVNPVTATAEKVRGLSVNYTTDEPFRWINNKSLLVLAVPEDRGKAPEKSPVPSGPIVEETTGGFSQMVTYQDLLKSPHDDDLFEYYCKSQLTLIDSETGAATAIGKPEIFADYRMSPDQKYILVEILEKPYSHRVPYYYFKRRIQVWDRAGNEVHTLARLAASEEVPRFGVPEGPRNVQWQPFRDATLFCVEAMDFGDPMATADYRDAVYLVDAPFKNKPRLALKLKERFAGVEWLSKKDMALISQYDRLKKWIDTYLINLGEPSANEGTIFSRSSQDDYNNPGTPVRKTLSDGSAVSLQDGDDIFLQGKGASKDGDMPFLRKFNLKTKKTKELFRSNKGEYEEFIDFAGNSRNRIVTWHQSPKDYPNFYLIDLSTKKRTLLSDFTDPAPWLKGVKNQIVNYKRSDGVPLSGILYLPPGYRKGQKLPLIMWAYPREYNDPSTAGQMRGSPYMFTRLYWCDPKFFLLKGYAFFQGAMPVVGNPEQVNNTFKQQIVANAKAAIDHLDSLGIIDRKKVLIGGHSYGAFMTAHLLAHSDLFAAGIARSGAYNRTLTPFGFQSERRSFWEAPEFYLDISPITHANKIKKPLLIIHGQEDSNPGTYPMQSERLFQAIKGNGGTAKLIMLPLEDHHYYARESNLHVLYEMLNWAEKYVKNR